ncbi:MAG: dihydropteroate synthase [Deferribacteres bacterium]|nr:dihydropteroate synthase [Deferribacteres bacterium]
MFVIGEKINVLNKTVYESIVSADLSPVISLAILQVESGADALDINLGPDLRNGEEIMEELVMSIQRHVDVPLCLNGTPGIIKAGLAVHKGRAVINGVTGERERMESLLDLAREFNARIIGMTVPGNGYAEETDSRCVTAVDIAGQAARRGIDVSDIYMDPVLSPLALSTDALLNAVRSIHAFKEMIPGVKTLVGLSNISQGISKKNRRVINNTALGVMAGAGLDAAILNPLDRVVAETSKTVKLLCRSGVYCDAYLCG